ncbi:MAG TPA: response regulator [Candidatus Acidoferrales bacterium]|nr:response regulator [Candidatus Acidoferrales bacterium]
MRRLLIVDDDAAIRKLFRINLADDYEIVDTEDPEQALALAMKHRPDAILLDLRMPKFSGFDLCRTFNSYSQTQLVPIFVVSGESGAEMKESCEALGAAAFFEKPIDFEALKARLATVKRHKAVPRSEIRVQLRVPLRLRGSDIDGKIFEEMASTENASLNGFLCACPVRLNKESVVEVFLGKDVREPVGTARCITAESHEGSPPKYGFRFIQKTGAWILQ